ncbi:MAG: hypothetical protein K6F07_03570 [Bacilli bacterium]|nr:hypothetical protein [Bacilli bacterium]
MLYAAIDREFFDQYGFTPADIPINRINWQEDPTIITYHDLDYIERNLIADKGYVLLTRIGINDASLGSSTIYHYMSFYTDTAWQGKCNRLLVENYSYYQSLLNSERFNELQYYFPDELLANVDEIKVAIQGFQGEFDEEGLNEYLSTMSIENRNYKEFSYYLIRYKGIFYRQQYVDGQSVEQLFINAADEFYAKYESDFDHAVMDQDVDNIINTLDSLVNNYSLLDSYKERLVDATNKWLKAHLVEDVEVVMDIYNTLDIYIERIASIDATLNEEEVNKQAKAIMEEYIAYLRGFFANMGE